MAHTLTREKSCGDFIPGDKAAVVMSSERINNDGNDKAGEHREG